MSTTREEIMTIKMQLIHSSTAFLILLTCVHCQETSTRFDNPIANLTTVWENTGDVFEYSTGLIVRPILIYSRGSGSRYACGFYRIGINSFLFGVFMVQVNSISRITSPMVLPQLVWSANGNRPVGENATLEFTGNGDLILRDQHKIQIWSTNTSNVGVLTMEMQESGNLVLVDSRNETAWQSFDHPTDSLVIGQTLRSGMKLVSSVSAENYSEGLYSLEMKENGIFLSVKGSPVQTYWSLVTDKKPSGDITPFMVFTNGTILIFVSNASASTYPKSQSGSDSDAFFILPLTSQAQYLKMDFDGSLKRLELSGVWRSSFSVESQAFPNSQASSVGICGLPKACGMYGVCNGGQCSCLSDGSFVEEVVSRPDFGCRLSTPLVCNSKTSGDNQHLLTVTPSDYFALSFISDGLKTDSVESCKQMCLGNCSCKIAFYSIATGSSISGEGICYLLDEVYTLRSSSYRKNLNTSTTAFIKMQNIKLRRKSFWSRRGKLLLGILFSFLTALIIIVSAVLYRRNVMIRRAAEDLILDSLPGVPKRYSYRELSSITQNFTIKLGQGGFGSVFLGVLADDTKVAVKRLESAKQGHKEFRAEVSIIGSIQHLNLVQLKGFCAEKNQRLLAYEYVANGSLEKWLFTSTTATTKENDVGVLNWETRFHVAMGTARGLAYLHEECREKILHLDIKPQNILLDDLFNAKVCDFGMSKLMDREVSEIFTTMRGTPGYLAPEWLHSSVTEKADVYSYGIVLLEIVSGRKCLNNNINANSENRYLPNWAMHQISKGRITEIVDKRLEAQSQIENEAKMLIHIALCCLQEDPLMRPSMGIVVQMLEGLVDVPEIPELSFKFY